MTLRCIDIASHQAGIDVASVDCDCVIVKVSGGVSYENPYWRQWARAALDSGKLLGLYNYACEYGSEPGGVAEANYFWERAKEFEGRFIPILDWEDHASGSVSQYYAVDFLKAIAKLSGAEPWFYCGADFVNNSDLDEVAACSHLWKANYLYRYDGSGWVDDPDQGSYGNGPWDDMTAYQYTSTGDIGGYDGPLDLSAFYGDRADWERMCGKSGGKKEKGGGMRINEIAAAIHLDMVEDDANGYSQAERHGADGDYKELIIDGRDYGYNRGDRDCSSSVTEAWQLALKYTPYEGVLDGASYTGNMRRVFVDSGLFEVWDTDSTSADTGDVYLTDVSGGHTAMCQSPANPDTLSEFSGSETGGIYGERGDQTGWEGHVCGFYDGWDCTLHYNGKADDTQRDDGARRHDVCMWTSHGRKNQRWKLVKKGADKKGVALYAIRNLADGFYLDVASAEDKDGADVILWSEYHGGKNQLWKFMPIGKTRTFKIVSAMKGARVLDVAGGSTEEGADLCIWPDKGESTGNQVWAVLKNKDGTRTIVNNGAGAKRVLDAAGQA